KPICCAFHVWCCTAFPLNLVLDFLLYISHGYCSLLIRVIDLAKLPSKIFIELTIDMHRP
ncbi:MAG: hypothetical protein M3129_02690, partial [Thermoproteota archaeon]|nr:hypothetical protein [Thermoproteota archaeon]